MRADVIDPLKAPRQLVATLTTQASVVHHVRWLESELALSARQDHSLTRWQAAQRHDVILPCGDVLGGNTDELVALALAQAWELR